MDFEERTNLLTICFAYKTKAQVLEYLERVPYPWAERAIAIVEERGRDRFEGNLAAHLALIPNRNSTEGISKKMDMSKAGGVEPTSVARQTRFGRVPAPSGESEAVSRSDAGSNDQPASSIASTHVGGATPSPEDLNPQPTHPIRATRSTQKLVSPPANANATASDIASRLFPTNPVGQPTPAPRTTPASPPPAPIFIIPTLSAGYPAHSVFVYARLVPLPALTTEAILAHPSFRQLYLGQDLMKATKPVLPHSVMVDKDRAKQYNALLSHLALGRDILYSWANNPVLCRNSKKAGYQLDDIQDWIEVIRTGREERMRELSGNGGAAGNGSAERRNVTFAQVLERVRIIEARDEGEEDEECDEDEYGGDAVATGDEIEWGVEPELEMEGVVPAGEAWC
ncbi:hypothetical protein BU16DRAFT_527197 [Lophium mytilinum]|uniref:Uncharacterized protein n=1 Tax=Lophium mytilinum TaxID=390894 RepID=A0A6A6QWI2_9PEZI|nr:hypothetical protein BU16DRAFT_527197 [Lophium mytilinum]